MKLTVEEARLIERKSDEQDTFGLVNSMRTSLNRKGEYERSVTTTDATPTEIWRDTVNDRSSLHLWMAVTAAASPDFAAYTRRVILTRSGGGAAVIQANDALLTDFETAAAWDITTSVDVGDVVLSVTGAAGVTIAWRVTVLATWSPFT